MALSETLKKISIEILVFSVSGVICIVGSFVLIKRVFPQTWFQPSSVQGAPVAPVKEHGTEPKPKEEHGKEKSKEHGGEEGAATGGTNFPLKTVIVNLADTNVRRIAKVSLTMQLKDPKVVEELQKIDPQIYDTLIKILSHDKYEEISSLEGKEAFKEEVKNRINLILKDDVITGVFITELIVQ